MCVLTWNPPYALSKVSLYCKYFSFDFFEIECVSCVSAVLKCCCIVLLNCSESAVISMLFDLKIESNSIKLHKIHFFIVYCQCCLGCSYNVCHLRRTTLAENISFLVISTLLVYLNLSWIGENHRLCDDFLSPSVSNLTYCLCLLN